MNNKNVIATNGEEIMTIEEFLNWELNGGKGTYESDLGINDTKWEDLSLEDKITYMASSIIGDVLSENWRFEVR